MELKLILKHPEKKESSIYTEFKRGGQKFKFYTGKIVETGNWLSKGLCSSKHKNHREINEYLKNWKAELERIIEDLEAKKVFLTREKIQEELDRRFNKRPDERKAGEPDDFISFYDRFIESHKEYTPASITILRQNRKHVIYAFGLLTKKHQMEYDALSSKAKSNTELKPDRKLPFERINLEFLRTFRDYLHTARFTKTIRGVEVDCNYKLNYIGKHIKQLNQIVDAAMEAGYVGMFIRKSVKAKFEEVDSIYTNFDELQRFVKLDLSKFPDQELVRDKYVLNCFLGLRYSDLNKMDKHLFSWRFIDGQRHLIYTGRQIKTDNRVEFPVHSNAVAILQKYNLEMPKIHEVEFNRIIKKVAEKAEMTDLFRKRETRGYTTEQLDIPKYLLISSHTGRRSFCTNYYQQGINIQAIMSVSGHKTEKEFLKYVKAGVRVEVMVTQLAKIPNFSSSKSA